MPAAVHTTLGTYDIADARSMLGQLISARAGAGFTSQYLKQVDAWEGELRLLEQLSTSLAVLEPGSREWHLLLEYPIPRRNKCPDAVLLADDVIFIIEFKVGAALFDTTAKWQVEDYALDLRDFHLESHGRTIIPVLVATDAASCPALAGYPSKDSGQVVWPVLCVNPSNLAAAVASLFRAAHRSAAPQINLLAWEGSAYRPSLSIIEAAQQLFASHDVREISHAYADNLSITTDRLVEAIHQARQERRRTICFVTGVPGAGKTLTGLNAVHQPGGPIHSQGEAVFLSGNGPLVRIVRAALVQEAAELHRCSKKDAAREVGTFIQNVHSFINEYVERRPANRPHESVVVFDEAQRAWNAEQVHKKRGINRSEPSTMLQVMERCPDWCVIVALVGGGQEIHAGETGLEEWGRSLADAAGRWQVLASPHVLTGEEGLAGHRLFAGHSPPRCEVWEVPSLHLSVSVRSFRAQMLAEWVDLVLQGKWEEALRVIGNAGEFPLVLTRDLARARRWLRDRSRKERRCGLVVSSGSVRHRAYGIETSSAFRKGYPYESWFLSGPDDVRSSSRLEVAATEFECQGLELDWVGLCWGDDLCIDPCNDRWRLRQFRGNRWLAVIKEESRRYLLNKYRVLLTRAREGMVIWIPPGDPDDPTRDPAPLSATAAYLVRAGVRSLD